VLFTTEVATWVRVQPPAMATVDLVRLAGTALDWTTTTEDGPRGCRSTKRAQGRLAVSQTAA